MKMILGILLLCLCHNFSFAHHKAKIDSLKKLGRDALIELASNKHYARSQDEGHTEEIIK